MTTAVHSQNAARLERAIAPYQKPLSMLWGNKYPYLVRYLTFATAPWQHNVRHLQQSIKQRPGAPTLVLVGERGCPADGSVNGQLTAAVQAVKIAENAGNPFHVLFTGGVYGLESLYGERPAADLYDDFNRLTANAYRRHCSTEQLSQNTGHQARVIGQMIASLGFGRAVSCIPIEHVARFTATLAFDVVERELALHLICFGNGDWSELIPQRNMTRAHEAFGPIQTPDDSDAMLATKLLGGEYGERYFKEQSAAYNKNYACGAVDPEMMVMWFGASNLL